MVVGGHAGLAHDATHGSRINHEILPEFLRRADTRVAAMRRMSAAPANGPAYARSRFPSFPLLSFPLLSFPHYPFMPVRKSLAISRIISTIRSVRSAATPRTGCRTAVRCSSDPSRSARRHRPPIRAERGHFAARQRLWNTVCARIHVFRAPAPSGFAIPEFDQIRPVLAGPAALRRRAGSVGLCLCRGRMVQAAACGRIARLRRGLRFGLGCGSRLRCRGWCGGRCRIVLLGVVGIVIRVVVRIVLIRGIRLVRIGFVGIGLIRIGLIRVVLTRIVLAVVRLAGIAVIAVAVAVAAVVRIVGLVGIVRSFFRSDRNDFCRWRFFVVFSSVSVSLSFTPST